MEGFTVDKKNETAINILSRLIDDIKCEEKEVYSIELETEHKKVWEGSLLLKYLPTGREIITLVVDKVYIGE
jgi:hypothetical protein